MVRSRNAQAGNYQLGGRMTDEQIKTYVRQAAEEASRAPSDDLFRAFARALPTTVLNVLVNSGKKPRPYDPTEFPFGKNEHLLMDAAHVLGRMYGDAARSLRYPMVGTALGMEGYRRQFPKVAIHVPANPFNEDELEMGYQSLLLLPLKPDGRTQLEQDIDRIFPRSARERRQRAKRRRRARLMLALGLLILLWFFLRHRIG